MPFIWIILSQCENNVEQKNAMCVQKTGFLNSTARRVYRLEYN